jgi:NAD(P)-dependent dehydrogenase (short-subunit alcohol dehydrogenase family)
MTTTGTPITDRRVRPDRRGPLAGQVALVTGGGRGIGQVVATALAGAGADVGLIARSRDELAATAQLVGELGGEVAAAAADVTDAAALAAAVAALRDRLGPVDLLVNNAGMLGPIGPLWEVDADDWWTTMDVNLRGILLCSQLVLPDMVAQRHGRIINVTSQAGAYRWPLVSAYSVSKAAVVKLTENLAHEASRHGIAVFSFHPGLLPIGMTTSVAGLAPTTAHVDHVQRWAEEEMAGGRGADPVAAVDSILRLATGDADSLSGRHLSVHDDLDALLARVHEVRSRDLYVLRPERLSA